MSAPEVRTAAGRKHVLVVSAAMNMGHLISEEELSEVVAAIEAEAIATERARIRDAMRAMHDPVCACPGDGSDDGCNWHPGACPILAIVNGEAS